MRESGKSSPYVGQRQPSYYLLLRPYTRKKRATQMRRTPLLAPESSRPTRPATVPRQRQGSNSRRLVRSLSREQKNSWYAGTGLDEYQQRVCRCRDEVTGGSRSPYGICISSVGRSGARETGQSEEEMRSHLARTLSSGLCGKSARFDLMPTVLLYNFAVEHAHTAKGRSTFGQPGALPNVKDFDQNPDRYRQQLLQLIRQYKQSNETKR